MHKQPLFFAGSSNQPLAKKICEALSIPLAKISLNLFPDGETHVELLEDVRGKDVFLLQSIAKNPNYYLMELMIIIDAVKRSSAKTITAIIPYLGYCRQDRKSKSGEPITAKLIANLLATAGISHLITCDLHSDQAEGFFETTVDHIHCQPLFFKHLKNTISEAYVVVAPDVGGIKIAERMTKLVDTELVVIKKERMSPFEVDMSLIGNVENKNVLIIDDMCSTGGTLIAAAQLCKKQKAHRIMAAITHGLFIGDALNKINSSPLELLLVTDTIEITPSLLNPNFQMVSVASTIAESIKQICG